MFLFLKRTVWVGVLLLCWFFQGRINDGDLSVEVNKDLHLTFVECVTDGKGKSWWQSSLFTGREFGNRVGFTSDAGWGSQTCLLLSPEQSLESLRGEEWHPPNPSTGQCLCSIWALFAVSPDNYKPTAVSPDSLWVCFVRRNSNPGESCGNLTSSGFFQLLWAGLVWVWFR